MLSIYPYFYICGWTFIESYDICLKKYILYMCRTKIHEEKHEKREQPTKRSPNKNHKRPTGFDSARAPEKQANAWLSNHNKHTKKLRRLLRSQHRLPNAEHAWKEGTSQKRMGHDPRETPQSIHTHPWRTKFSYLHRRVAESHHKKNVTKICSRRCCHDASLWKQKKNRKYRCLFVLNWCLSFSSLLVSSIR